MGKVDDDLGQSIMQVVDIIFEPPFQFEEEEKAKILCGCHGISTVPPDGRPVELYIAVGTEDRRERLVFLLCWRRFHPFIQIDDENTPLRGQYLLRRGLKNRRERISTNQEQLHRRRLVRPSRLRNRIPLA